MTERRGRGVVFESASAMETIIDVPSALSAAPGIDHARRVDAVGVVVRGVDDGLLLELRVGAFEHGDDVAARALLALDADVDRRLSAEVARGRFAASAAFASACA